LRPVQSPNSACETTPVRWRSAGLLMVLASLRRDRLRMNVACPDEAHPRIRQAEGERSLEAAGVGLRWCIDSKGLTASSLPLDPLDPHESPRTHTYCTRGNPLEDTVRPAPYVPGAIGARGGQNPTAAGARAGARCRGRDAGAKGVHGPGRASAPELRDRSVPPWPGAGLRARQSRGICGSPVVRPIPLVWARRHPPGRPRRLPSFC
jgi:hypothetical protein